MMPVVRVNDAAFADLSTLRTWYGTKTVSDTIDRVIREMMDQLGMERDDEAEEPAKTTVSEGPMEFKDTPGLAFTKPLSATVNGKAVHSPRWSSILTSTVGQLKNKGLEGQKLVDELKIGAKVGNYSEDGFSYHATLGISLQGQSASDAWKEIERIATKWRIPVVVEFWWRPNPKAQYPGKTGILRTVSN